MAAGWLGSSKAPSDQRAHDVWWAARSPQPGPACGEDRPLAAGHTAAGCSKSPDSPARAASCIACAQAPRVVAQGWDQPPPVSAPTGASPAAAGGDGLLCLDTGRRKPRGPGMVTPSSAALLGLAPVALCMCTCVRICACVPSPAGSALAENPLPHAEKRPFFAVTIQYN